MAHIKVDKFLFYMGISLLTHLRLTTANLWDKYIHEGCELETENVIDLNLSKSTLEISIAKTSEVESNIWLMTSSNKRSYLNGFSYLEQGKLISATFHLKKQPVQVNFEVPGMNSTTLYFDDNGPPTNINFQNVIRTNGSCTTGLPYILLNRKRRLDYDKFIPPSNYTMEFLIISNSPQNSRGLGFSSYNICSNAMEDKLFLSNLPCQLEIRSQPRRLTIKKDFDKNYKVNGQLVELKGVWFDVDNSSTGSYYVVDCLNQCPDIYDYSSKTPSHCPAGESKRNGFSYTLKETPKGENFTFACPVPLESTYATWICTTDGSWDTQPDLSQCRSNITLFRPPEENVTLTAVDNITSLVENIQKEALHLLPGDVIVILQGVKDLQKQNKQDQGNQTTFMERVIDVMGNVTNAPRAFEMPQEKRRKTMTDIQRTLSEESLKQARSLKANSTFGYQSEAVGLKLKKKSMNFYQEKAEHRRFFHDFSKSTEIQLPENLLGKNKKGTAAAITSASDDYDVVVVVHSYKDLQCAWNSIPCDRSEINIKGLSMTGQVNSLVIGATVGLENWIADEGQYVRVKLSHIYQGPAFELRNRICVWWNISHNSWSADGCELADMSSDAYTVCHCTHLTNLAVIMDITGVVLGGDWVTIIGCSLSVVCLVLTIFTLVIVKRDRMRNHHQRGTKHYMIQMHLCVCLLLFLFVFLLNEKASGNEHLCTAVAILLHFLLLAAFTWSTLSAIEISLRLFTVLPRWQPKAKHYLVFGYTFPLLFIVLTLSATQLEGYLREKW